MYKISLWGAVLCFESWKWGTVKLNMLHVISQASLRYEIERGWERSCNKPQKVAFLIPFRLKSISLTSAGVSTSQSYNSANEELEFDLYDYRGSREWWEIILDEMMTLTKSFASKRDDFQHLSLLDYVWKTFVETVLRYFNVQWPSSVQWIILNTGSWWSSCPPGTTCPCGSSPRTKWSSTMSWNRYWVMGRLIVVLALIRSEIWW